MGKYIIEAQALADLIEQQDPHLLVLDCRFSLADTDAGQMDYALAHIPGAHYVHLDSDLSALVDPAQGGRHPLPAADALQSTFRRLGVSADTHVVIYDDQRFAFAARCWWLLRYLGHESVQLLDGGFNGWRELGYAVTEVLPEVVQGDFCASPRAQLVVDINSAKTVPLLPSAVLIDSRERPRFLGREEPIDPVAGHINGACNYPWQDVTDERGFYRADQQRQRWGELLGIDELVVYCGSGVTACANLLSLAECGRDDAALYVGGWSEWCRHLG